MPLRPGIEQIDRARRGLARDFDPGHLVSELEGQFESDLCGALASPQVEPRLAKTLAARGKRVKETLAIASTGTHDGCLQLPRIAHAGRKSQCLLARIRLDHRQTGAGELHEL